MKKNNHLSERLPASTFIILSGLVSAIVSGTGALSSRFAFEHLSFNTSWYIFAVVAWLPTIFIIIGQSFLFKYQFAWSAIRWLIAGFFAIILMIAWNFAYSILLGYISYSLALYWLLRRVPTLILALTQFIILRNYISRAWLWILAMLGLSIVNLPLYSLLNPGTIANSTSFAHGTASTVMGGIQGLVTAMVLTWLIRRTIKDEQGEATTENLISEQSSL